MSKRPITTLFMLMSVDGKISTGANDKLDFDQDLPRIDGIKEGLHQYYEIEQTTDLWSLNSGRVQAKIGVNQRALPEQHSCVSFVILDNHHLTTHGIEYFCALSKHFVLVTSNKNHPAFSLNRSNLTILYYEKLDLKAMLEELNERFSCERLTIQSGSTLNALFLKEKLFDYVDIIVAPALIGGTNTSSLIGGQSLTQRDELNNIGVLQLEKVTILENSYLRIQYKVIL